MNTKKGFAQIAVIIALLIVLGLGGYYLATKDKVATTEVPDITQNTQVQPITTNENPTALTDAQIKNASIDDGGETVQLKDGNGVNDGQTRTYQVTDIIYGELNGDGLADAVANVFWQGMGEHDYGAYSEVFINQNGKPWLVGYGGGRATTITNGEITTKFANTNTEQALTTVYKLENSKLVVVKQTEK